MPAAPDVDPDIVVNYLKTLGVTAETTKAIKEQVCVRISEGTSVLVLPSHARWWGCFA